MQAVDLLADALLLIAAAALTWVSYTAWPETIRIKSGMLIKRHRFRTETMRLTDLESVNFHYQAIVGFDNAWEFVDKSGRTLCVNGLTFRRKLIRQLEQNLHGFSASKFDHLFAEGDVEDSLEIWRAEPVTKLDDAHLKNV